MECIRYLPVCLVNYTKGRLRKYSTLACQFECLPNAIIGPQLVQQLQQAIASIGAKLMLYYVYAACSWPARTSARAHMWQQLIVQHKQHVAAAVVGIVVAGERKSARPSSEFNGRRDKSKQKSSWNYNLTASYNRSSIVMTVEGEAGGAADNVAMCY